MNEIAQKAKVSMTTVSRVLNEDVSLKISDAKRQRVLDVAKEMNYTSIRGKRKKREKIHVGLIHWYKGEYELLHPYFLQVRACIEKYCSLHQIEWVRLEHEDVYDYKKTLHAIIATGIYDQEESEYIAKMSDYAIFIDHPVRPVKYDSVSFDYHQGLCDVVDYFRKLGHQRIGYIGGSKYLAQFRCKQGSIKEQFRKELLHTTGVKEEWFLEGENTAESGYKLMKQMLRTPERPTAVFIESGLMSVGVYRALNEAGKSIPDDMSLVALSDFGGEAYLMPSLTTLTGDIDALAETIVERIKEVATKKRYSPRQVLLPLQFEVRESCKIQ